MDNYTHVKTHDLLSVKECMGKDFAFFYRINRRQNDAVHGVHDVLVSTAYLIISDVDGTALKGKKIAKHGIFCVDFQHGFDGSSYERIVSRDFGENWNEIVNEHMERHLVDMACVLSDERLKEQTIKNYHPSQFLMGFGYPFSVEETKDGNVEDDEDVGQYSVVTHNHAPICSFPCLTQAELVCNALNTYNQPHTF